jgi:uncharacterized membrane protein
MENPNSRLEAFSDGVFAIALTLLIIELKVPNLENIHSSAELWIALQHMLPMVFAFLLSFGIILITWVNHHATLKLMDKSSPQLMYANGYFLLVIVAIPFPSALLGETILSDYAAPGVVLYSTMNIFGAIGWNLLSRVALKQQLTRGEKAFTKLKEVHKNSYFAITMNTVYTILAFWFPLTMAVVITLTWIGWLIYGMTIKEEELLS